MSDRPDDMARIEERVNVEDAADAYLKTFAVNGVDYFFNSPGTEFAPFWDHFAAELQPPHEIPTSKHGIGYIGCRHEEVAIHMAMGYTLMTGDPQVVGFHVNVGSLHAAMSIHGAYQSRIPMVILTSHADTHENEVPGGTPGSHYLNFNAPGGFEDFFARYLKWFAHPERTVNTTKYLSRAFRLARTSPSGPTLLNLSRELLYDSTTDVADIVRDVPATRPVPSQEKIAQIAEELTSAENPIIISGKVASGTPASEHLQTLAERLHAPVMETPKWHHGFPVEHPLSLGDRTFVSHYLKKDIDAVLVVDSKRPWYPPIENAPEDASVIMISPEPEKTKLDYWNYPVDSLLTGDAESTLDALLSQISAQEDTGPVDWVNEHDQLRTFWAKLAQEGEEDQPIDPFWLCSQLNQVLPDNAVLVEETTVHKAPINNLLEAKDRSYIGAGRALAGGRGGGLGMALGAKLANPDRPVFALVGDGAFNYNPVSAAFGAAQQYQLPFTTIIFNNSGYRSQRDSHVGHFPGGKATETGRFPGSSIQPQPEYEKQAEAWNAYSETIEDAERIVPAVDTALGEMRNGRAALLDIRVKRESPRDKLESPP